VPPKADTPIAHVREHDQAIQTVAEHLEGVATLSGLFATKFNCGAAGELLGLLHDMGKYSAEFQAYLRSATNLDPDGDEGVDAVALKGKVDHSSAGAQYIWHHYGRRGKMEQALAQLLAICIASHHSGLIDCIGGHRDNFGQDIFGKRMAKDDAKTHLQEVMAKADAHILKRAETLLAEKDLTQGLQSFVARILQTAQARLPEAHHDIAANHFALFTRMLFSCLIDADRMDTADFEHVHKAKVRAKGRFIPWPELVDRLEQHLASFPGINPIDAIRRDIAQHCVDGAQRAKGIYTLTVPTGGGKTLASLRFALHHANRHQMDRVIYVIPFTSIIDQNAAVVRGVLESQEGDEGRIVLEHHASLTPELQTWRQKMLSENWDAPVVYTTMVQFLDTLFSGGTRGARRMHQLANSVLVFDEIQTLPIRCVHLFNNALNFLVDHCKCTVVLCSATQPLLHRVAAPLGALNLSKDADLMPNVGRLFEELRRVTVQDLRRPQPWPAVDIASLVSNTLPVSRSALVIVNTKDAASSIYRACQTMLGDTPLYHLSTSMCPNHRKAVLARIRDHLDRQEAVVCISTQLIEAGVDVDFGAVVRSMAGLDSMAQAAGRCNRNGRRPQGQLLLINPADENVSRLVDIHEGKLKSELVLHAFHEQPAAFDHDLLGPKAMASYYQLYFHARAAEMAYKLSAKDIGHDDTLFMLNASNELCIDALKRSAHPAMTRLLRQSFMTAAQAFKAIDAPTQGVIVPFGEAGKALCADLYAAFDIELEIALLKRAQQFTVSVFTHQFKKLMGDQALHEVKPGSGIYSVDARYYHPQLGLMNAPCQDMEVLCV
jgi:CRISPR-associated endonuclease/helicase Cas3